VLVTRTVLLALLALALLAAPASAQSLRTPTGGAVQEAAQALRTDPVYVSPDARPTLTSEQIDALRDRIAAQDAGPLFIAILSPDAVDEVGGNPSALPEQLYNQLRRPGTYAVVSGTDFRAGATTGMLDARAGDLVQAAIQEGGSDLNAILTAFVDNVAQSRASAGGGVTRARDNGSGDEGGVGFSGVFLLILAVLGGGAFLLSRRRRAKEDRAEFEEAKDNARDDLIALGDDIRALDIDMELDTTPVAAKEHYARAVEAYERAEGQWERARHPEELEPVGEALEEGRYEMLAAKAIMEGRPEPERRPPCFFDPRHGPSSRDVEWAPPEGAPRLVPACEADAQRVERGDDPAYREVLVGGERMPYWNAGPAYAPFAGGFFGGMGGGILPGLLIGTALGSTIGGLGAGAAYGYPGDYGYGDGGDFDAGGGDFGGGFDFGGGDFGGGDFGGGDFGGGGDF